MPTPSLRLPALSLLAMLWGLATTSQSQQTPAPAAPSDPHQRVVLTVNGEPLTAADVEKIIETLPVQSRDYYAHEGRRLLPQYLVRMKVLAQEARQQKLDEQPDIRKTIEVVTESILADAARKQITEGIAVPQDQLLQLYQSRAKQYEEVRIRRILIRTESSILSQSSAPIQPPLSEAEARKKLEELRRQITEGASFAELAKVNSDDLDSAPSGGDLGYVNYQTVIPPILQAAYALSPGEVSDIIATPFGMELIQLIEKRVKPLSEVRPELEAMMRQGKLEDKLQELQQQYTITLDDSYFTPPSPANLPSGTGSAPPGR